MSWAKINIQKKYKNYFVMAVFVFSLFAFSSNAQAATQIFYSVGQNTTSHETGAGNVTVSGTTATFTVAQTATNMGVGDVIDYDTDNKKCYISGKTSTTVWSCTNATGGTPTSATGVIVNSVSHAFNSLSAAEAGAPTLLGNSNLTTIDVQLNFPCYYDTGADTTAVVVDGYTTDATRYIKIYTPNNTTTEVNQSQRHNGKWDDGKYRISNNNSYSNIVDIKEAYTIIMGLQLDIGDAYASFGYVAAADYVMFDSCIAKAIPISANAGFFQYPGNYTKFINCLSYGFIDGFRLSGVSTMYNCTAVGNKQGISLSYSTGDYKNILTTNNTISDFYDLGFSNPAITNSVSSDATADDWGGTGNKINQTVQFVDAANKDFHLLLQDTSARNAGVDLSADANLPFNTDIDGQNRPSWDNAVWDIGADEYTPPKPVYYSVGQNTTSHETGAGNVTVSGTTATFTVAQTATNMGVGDVIDYDTDNKKCYISGKTSTTVWTCTSATGGAPTSATGVVVNSVSHAFNSLFAAEAGAPTLLGNSNLTTIDVQLNFPCYYDSGADTTAVVVDGYTTDATRYIKIYTPNNTTTEVNQSQRHSGKWDDLKYRLETGTGLASLYSKEDYTVVDGLQIKNSGTSATDYVINVYGYSNYNNISSNILVGGYCGFYASPDSSNGLHNIFNNIVYNSARIGISIASSVHVASYVYNNTIYHTNYIAQNAYGAGISVSNIADIIKNNIAVDNYYVGSDTKNIAGGTQSYNISSDSSASGTGSLTNQTLGNIAFFSTTSGSEDFHIQNTSVAKDIGTDLSGTFTTDIDGAPRNASINAWDIGADETATQIYRSVGPSATAVLESDTSHARNVTLTSGVATFSVALSDSIGVGDAVFIDTGGTANAIDASDTLLFIHSRTSSTVYTLRTHTGSVPGNVSINDTYQIYRAYTSLSDAEAGTKNTSIPIAFNGGDRDLFANNEQWNIAVYANGVTADTTAVTVDGWNTGAQNFIKVYTPVSTNEVGVSQRHSGKWDDGKYRLEFSGNTNYLRILIKNIWVDGLQVKRITTQNYGTIHTIDAWAGNKIGNNIINVVDNYTNSNRGLYNRVGDGTLSYFWNNVIYGTNLDYGYDQAEAYGYLYNNTVIGAGTAGYNSGWQLRMTVKNNIAQGCVNGFNIPSNNFGAGSDYNISDLANDAPSPSYRTNLATDVSFVDEVNKDFHLAQADTAARNVGANLTADASLPFSTDIDGQLRNPVGAGWDIGADEGTVEFTPTVMQSGGDYSTLSSWEAGVQTDLVASTTRVFAHGGITGVIADNATVTGQTSGAIATVVHATANQILLEITSGTFASGETVQVTTGNSVVISDNGNPASAVAKIDGVWTVADGTAVTVDGWNTGADNYIKVYTTPTARHSGKWNANAYRLYYLLPNNYESALRIINAYNVTVEGLQIEIDNQNDRQGGNCLGIDYNNKEGIYKINNNIMKLSNGNFVENAIAISTYGAKKTTHIVNNIIYNFSNGGSAYGIYFTDAEDVAYLYNNTIYNTDFGISNNSAVVFAKNNLIALTTDPFSGTFHASSTNNSTDINDTPSGSSGTNYVNQAFNFVSVTSGSEDFHLAETDTTARDAGVDLSADPYNSFSTDIDGETRVGHTFDIGADEAAEKIYRSVGPGNVAALATDSSHANTITISNGVATFSAALADNVGVGDAVIIDTAGTTDTIDASDTLLFIHSRTSSTVYTLRTHTGSVPGDITVNDTYSIFRAYTSLSNAEAGTKNTGIPIATFNGGNRDLVANNEEWNIACYADATDTTAVDINGWTTGEKNYLKIYTPVNSSEVAVAQRHSGKWNGGKYNIILSSSDGLIIRENYVRLEGLQINNTNNVSSNPAVNIISQDSALNRLEISETIITGDCGRGIQLNDADVNAYIKNTIVYLRYVGNRWPLYASFYTSLYAYNDTFLGNYTYAVADKITVAKNTYADHWYDASHWTNSNNNASADASTPGTNGLTNLVYADQFENVISGNENFHLKTRSPLIDAGVNLRADENFSFGNDIDNEGRPTGIAWDIGADEVDFAESVKMKGDVKVKGDVKFK